MKNDLDLVGGGVGRGEDILVAVFLGEGVVVAASNGFIYRHVVRPGTAGQKRVTDTM